MFSYGYLMQALGYLGARLDDAKLVRRALEGVRKVGEVRDYPMAVQMQDVLQAELERMEGEPVRAAARLAPVASRHDALTLVHGSRLRALLAARNDRDARTEAQWLAGHRGRAWVERPAGDLLNLVAVYDSTLALLVQAEVASRLDARAEAGEFASAFEAAWPRENLPRSLRERLATVR